jgi:hypothetical protein
LARCNGCTLEKTDQTLRETLATTKAFNRAFVFARGIKEQQVTADNKNSLWAFLFEVENNGNTQTVDASVGIACDKPPILDLFRGVANPTGHRVFGPKQVVGAGNYSPLCDGLTRV